MWLTIIIIHILGNYAKKLLLYGKDVLPSLINNKQLASTVGKIAELFYVVVRVLNTDRLVDVSLYKRVCHSIGILIVSRIKWARMNETIHSVSYTAVYAFVQCAMFWYYHLCLMLHYSHDDPGNTYWSSESLFLQILAHSWEIVQNNGGRGLKHMSEEGIEGIQKVARKVR